MGAKLVQAMLLIFSVGVAVQAETSSANAVNDGQLKPWFKSNYTRGVGYPVDVYPSTRGSSQQVYICSGAGCPIRLRFHFGPNHRSAAEKVMNQACVQSTAKCELERLRAGVRYLETVVWKDLLYKADRTAIQRAWDRNSQATLTRDPGYNQQLTLDCVDQATNGTSYLVVLARWNLIKRYKIAPPGLEHIGFIQPHFYTRLQGPKGEFLKFDLYDRSNSSLQRRLPYVAREPGNRNWR